MSLCAKLCRPMKRQALNYESETVNNLVNIEIQIDEDGWTSLDKVEDLCKIAVQRACIETKQKFMQGAELCILLTNDTEICKLNKQWRGLDKPTNVLSFPAVSPEKLAKSPMLGDIALGFQTVEKEAINDQKTIENHLTHLIIHGFLHILGYDHEIDEDATIMEALEIRILENLNIANPYADCDLLSMKHKV